MNAIDAFDIREAFEALDDEACLGRLTYVQLQTLYLGLGFTYPKCQMMVEDLQEDARTIGLHEGQSLTLKQTLQLFRKYSRDRTQALKESFDGLVSVIKSKEENDTSRKDHCLTASDLVQAATTVNLVLDQHVADYMIDMVRGSCSNHRGNQSYSRKKGGSQHNQGVSREDFLAFWAPPDP